MMNLQDADVHALALGTSPCSLNDREKAMIQLIHIRIHMIAAIAFFLLVAQPSAARGLPLPDGWAPFTPAAVNIGPNAKYRSSIPDAGLLAAGDFYGDGKQDIALLAFNADRCQYGMLVFLSRRPSSMELIASGPARQASGIALRTLAPGRYQAACAKGYGPKKDECPPNIAIETTHDAIELMAFESASSIYYMSNGRFHKISMSD